MKDVEIVVFNDKSWERLTEYQKIKEENEQLAKRICELQSDLGKARETIKAMKTCPVLICHNCQQDCIANTDYNKDWFNNWDVVK